MNDWKRQGRGPDLRERDESWRGRNQNEELERYDERNVARSTGYERDHGGARAPWASSDPSRSYDHEVDDRGHAVRGEFYSRDEGARGWNDRAPNRGPDMPRRMMDETAMARGYRSPAERVGDRGQGYDAWRQADHARQGASGTSERGWSDPGRYTAEPRDSYAGYPRPVGKPPKGYVRSDDRIREDICEALAAHGHDWSDVEVQVSSGEVTLTGSVPDRRQKYDAEHLADGIRGVSEVTNQIRVKSARSSAEVSAPGTNGTDETRRRNVGRS